MTDKIGEIRARHLRLEDMRSSTYPDEISDSWTYFGTWAAHHDRATLLAENDRLREVLQFYADPNRYKSTSVHMCGHSTGQSVMIDGGRKAREALGVKS